jgi:DNA polymerase-2
VIALVDEKCVIHPTRYTLQPVFDAILPFFDNDFATLIGGQLGLF